MKKFGLLLDLLGWANKSMASPNVQLPRETKTNIAEQTIRDFGEQWTNYDNTDGYFGSTDLLVDFIQPFDAALFAGAKIADIGAGTGRHVAGLLDLEASHVYAIEPSKSVSVIERQFQGEARVSVLNVPGDQIPNNLDLDYVISIGVIHHIPEPGPVIRAAFEALKPGGKFIVWLYGKEGNRLYLAIARPLRALSSILPSRIVAALSWALEFPLRLYIAAACLSPVDLPLGEYMIQVLGRLPADKRRLVIYDQLKPAYAKYYLRSEVLKLMQQVPFSVELHHRMGYSWVAIGTKPDEEKK